MMKNGLFAFSIIYLSVAIYLLYSLLASTYSEDILEGEFGFISKPQTLTKSFSRLTPDMLTNEPVTSPRTFDLRIHVGKKDIEVEVNKKIVLSKNFNSSFQTKMDPIKFAGLYLIVLQEFTGRPLKSDRFLTLQMGGELELLKMLADIQPGRIIVLASLYESFQLISEIFRKRMSRQGSLAIKGVTPGDRWIMVWTKGGRVWSEETTKCKREPCALWQGGNLNLNLEIPQTVHRGCVSWPRNSYWINRNKFCQTYEGYGNLCSCENPLTFQFSAEEEFQTLNDTLVLIVASERPFVLIRCLKRLFRTRGFNPSKTLVSADGHSMEVEELVNIFDLKYINHDSNISDVSERITDHYRFALDRSFSLFPWVKKVIVLEDDLFVAPDIFSYFAQLAPILESDPSLYCVSAWNDFGFTQTASDPHVVQRTDTMPGLGWMLSRSLFEELRPKWPKSSEKADWDIWMRLKEQRKGRQCLIPEVSRTFHFGREGVHTSSQTQYLYYDDRKITKHEIIHLKGLDRLTKTVYEEDLLRNINSSIHLNGSVDNPCDENFLQGSQNKSYVLWFKMNHIKDVFTWDAVILCLGMWSPDIRGGYNKVWKLRFLGNELYIIGCPASPYSYLKPQNVGIVRRSTGQEGETEPPIVVEKLL